MAILVCSVNWNKCYQGIEEEDRKTDGENWNFLSMNERPEDVPVPEQHNLYGHVYVPANGNIRIDRLGADNDADYIDGISVVFCAYQPAEMGIGFVVIGWYNDARVYRESFTIPRPNNEAEKNRIRFTAHDDATLLPVKERHFEMPTTHTRDEFGGFGGLSPQAHIWYGLNKDEWGGLNGSRRDAAGYFRDKLCRYMKDPDSFVLEMVGAGKSDGDRQRGTSHPTLRDPNFRSRVLEADGGKCVLTGENTDKAIEAAHLVPAREGKDDRPCNGIMLRADLHRLFDARPRLFRFDTSGRVMILEETGFSENYLELLNGKSLPPRTLERVQATLKRIDWNHE